MSASPAYPPGSDALAHRPLWIERGRAFGIALAVAIVAYFALPPSLKGLVRAVTIFDCASSALLAMIWLKTISYDAAQTARRAAQDDPGRNIVFLIIVLASFAGIASAIGILGHPQQYKAPGESQFVLFLGIVGVALSWLLIQTTMTLRYAHLYYYDENDDGKPGGLKFPGDDAPSDYDFAYFSFVIGMTFQVSDVEITSRRIRRVVLGHGIVSFLFSAAIVALGVNILSGLIGK